MWHKSRSSDRGGEKSCITPRVWIFVSITKLPNSHRCQFIRECPQKRVEHVITCTIIWGDMVYSIYTYLSLRRRGGFQLICYMEFDCKLRYFLLSNCMKITIYRYCPSLKSLSLFMCNMLYYWLTLYLLIYRTNDLWFQWSVQGILCPQV